MGEVAVPTWRASILGRGSSVYPLLLLSGFAGLGYQVVWIRMLSIGLGHEVVAVLAVVAAFFFGLALGALVLDRRVGESKRPGLWYAGLEAVIGVWSLALIWLIPPFGDWVSEWMGQDPGDLRRWTVAFFAPMLLLLPATFAMGATLPAAERMYAALSGSPRGLGGLYAANTAGAMAGALLTAFLIAAMIGYSATLVVFAFVNFACAALTLIGPGRVEWIATRGENSERSTHRGLLAALFLTGFLGVGFEVAAVRALAQLIENTVYSFASALAIYLLGTALGAWAYQRIYAHRRGQGWDGPVASLLAAAVAGACAIGTLAVFLVAETYPALRASSYGLSLASELLAALVVIGPASVAMGALFSHLAQACRGARGGLGFAFAANTFGATFAPILIGVIAVPWLGVIWTMLVLSLLYLVLVIPSLWQSRVGPWLAIAAVLIAAAVAFGPFETRLVTPPPGGQVRSHLEGVAASASVVEDARGARYLRVNGTFTMGGTTSYALDRIQGHAALLQHPRPRRALFLGVGTGATLAAAVDYPGLRSEGVELLPETLDLIGEFPTVDRDLRRGIPRISLHVADARRYIRSAAGTYDVIVADNYHPAKDGTAFLYTVEHFRAIREKLTPDGVFVQWLPLHQLDLRTLRRITRTFMEVFPDARLQMGNYNLVTPILALSARRDGALPKLAALTQRKTSADLRAALTGLQIDTPFALFGGFIAGPRELSAFAGDLALNTDDHPRILYEAPDTIYRPLAPAETRLLALTEMFAPSPRDAVDPLGTPDHELFEARLAQYWRARDAFLKLGAEADLTGDPSRDARRIAPALIEIVRISPDFRQAYDPVLRLAEAAGQREPAFARRLLEALIRANPARPEARSVMDRIRDLR